MALSCFQNRIEIGDQTKDFVDGGGARTIDKGLYTWDTFRTAFLAAWVQAGERFGISADGFVTLDDNGGANFTITWTDTALRDLLGFTADLAGANSYTASRKIRGAWYPTKIVNAALIKPRHAKVTQETCLSGKRRTFHSGNVYDRCHFQVLFVDGVTELASPTGFFGTSYVGTGITDHSHARDFWWDTSVASSQGWSNGKPVRYFADRANAAIALGAAAGFTYTAANFSTWNFDQRACEDWANVAVEFRSPRTVHYTFDWEAQEEIV